MNVNDLSNAVQHSNVHDFTDDTNVLYISNSLKDINHKINPDVKNMLSD